MDAAVAAAKAAHESGVWRTRTPHERADLIDAIADNMAARLDELTALQVNENGATVRGARSFLMGSSIAHLRYFASLARSYAFERAGPLSSAAVLGTGLIRKEPVGVCAGIVPWNFPLLLAVWKLGPTLAAGNTVVVKPDAQTPLTLLVHRFDRGRQAGHARRRRQREEADARTRRKGANIVLDDADLDLAADGTLFGFLLMSGQACESGTRLLVHESIHDDFVERLVKRASTLTLGDPISPATDVGPLISDKQKARVDNYIALGKQAGCEIAFLSRLIASGVTGMRRRERGRSGPSINWWSTRAPSVLELFGGSGEPRLSSSSPSRR